VSAPSLVRVLADLQVGSSGRAVFHFSRTLTVAAADNYASTRFGKLEDGSWLLTDHRRVSSRGVAVIRDLLSASLVLARIDVRVGRVHAIRAAVTRVAKQHGGSTAIHRVVIHRW